MITLCSLEYLGVRIDIPIWCIAGSICIYHGDLALSTESAFPKILYSLGKIELCSSPIHLCSRCDTSNLRASSIYSYQNPLSPWAIISPVWHDHYEIWRLSNIMHSFRGNDVRLIRDKHGRPAISRPSTRTQPRKTVSKASNVTQISFKVFDSWNREKLMPPRPHDQQTPNPSVKTTTTFQLADGNFQISDGNTVTQVGVFQYLSHGSKIFYRFQMELLDRRA